MLQYTGSGLDYIYLKNGYEEHETPYGNSIAIHNLKGLHLAIALDIIKNRAVLSGDELRFLRIELGFSQRRLGELVGRSSQSVALWEKGKQKIPAGADHMVRLVALEMLNEAPHIVELIDRINELDRGIHEKRSFLETEGEWATAA
ncbi:MAG: transcriptional regulator [Sedimenticola sp.]